MSLDHLLLIFLICACHVLAALDLGYEGGDSDLTNFVTRPEIKSPQFNVTVHDASAISKGYWFVAPYIGLHEPSVPPNVYQPCQTGPHIYDAIGELVWTGACLVENQVTSDFRINSINNTDALSAILYRSRKDPKGHGILMDSSFTITDTIHVPNDIYNLDMHGLRIIEDGKTGLHVNHKTEWVDVADLAPRGVEQDAGFVMNSGFREFDVATGRTNFEWWMYDHVPLSHSPVKIKYLDGPYPTGWNPYHINSVDKDSNGDYLVSSRFTNCIYKISAKDGSIIWRLGGVESSFVLDGFNFSKQHDARFIAQNATTTIISFLDNASSGDDDSSSPYSSGFYIALETSVSPMVATVVQRIIRPDHQLTQLRGNVQLLPDGNTFVCWSDNSYISEHDSDGALLMEAQFSSHRFVTYRAYKFNFTGAPAEPPILKVFEYGTSPQSSTTVCYVSWNGATEVATWEFHRNDTLLQQPSLIGQISKTGFETMFQSAGIVKSGIYAKAISIDGEVLGQSEVEFAARSQGRPSVHPESGGNQQSTQLDEDDFRKSWSARVFIQTTADNEKSVKWYLYTAALVLGLVLSVILLMLISKISALLQSDRKW